VGSQALISPLLQIIDAQKLCTRTPLLQVYVLHVTGSCHVAPCAKAGKPFCNTQPTGSSVGRVIWGVVMGGALTVMPGAVIVTAGVEIGGIMGRGTQDGATQPLEALHIFMLPSAHKLIVHPDK